MKNITQVEIFIIPQSLSLIGFGTCVAYGSLRLSGLALHSTREGGIRIVFPAKRLGQNMQFYVQPLNEEITKEINEAFNNKARELGLFNYEA